MLFRQLYDGESSTYTYLLADLKLEEAILIDPVLDRVERDWKLLQELGLTLHYCLETHIHADHITGTGRLRELTGCLSVVSAHAKVNCANRHIQDEEDLELGRISRPSRRPLGRLASQSPLLVILIVIWLIWKPYPPTNIAIVH